MKEILFTAIALFAMVLFALIYPIVCLINHFKANNMTLKERIKLSIKEEFNPPIA